MEAIIKPKVEYSIFSIQKRLLSFLMIVAFIFCILVSRLFYLQISQSKNLQIHAVEQWVRTLPLTAKRGQIVDTNGNILAISYTSYDVFVRAKEVEDPVKVTAYLSSLLNIEYQSLYEKVINIFVSETLIKLQIDEDTALKIVQKDYKGVYVTENIKRYYPYGKALSQVIGFLTSDSIGQTGIEKYYNDTISGTDGKYLTQSDVRGITLDNSLNYYIDAINGLNISLNIDINIQVLAEQILEKIMQEHNPKKASILVMDPQTSKIISLAISPGFDLNDVPRDDVNALMDLSKNIAVTDVYEPGSTFKIFTLAIALSEGLVDLDDTFYCPGYRMVDGEKIKCWKTTGHGSQTLIEAVQNSCNCCFMDLALKIGKDTFYKYLNLFGIGSTSGVDVSGESAGILLDKNIVQNVDLARIGFGQTVAVSQIQLVNSFCSIINGGTLNVPSLLGSYFEDDKVVYENIVTKKNKTVSEDVSQLMRYILEQSLSKTGEMTFVEGYKIAGKTGTAQKYGEDGKISQGKYVSSFFGFLNQGDEPFYAVLIYVDEPSSGVYYGGLVAKPYAKELFEGIIKYKNIPKTDENVVVDSILTPNLLNLSLTKALVELEKLGIYYEVDGEGDKVVEQFPSPNTEILKSSTIIIKTN